MKSVSSAVKTLIEKRPFLLEAMSRGILSYGNLAEEILGEVEHETGREVTQSAVVMALRRFSEELRSREYPMTDSKLTYEISMKTNIFDINLVKRDDLLDRLQDVYGQVSIQRGDFLALTIGNNEISIAVSQKYRDQVISLFHDAQIIHSRDDLVAVTVIFNGDFVHTPGIISEAVRRLAWESINVYEILSTSHELTFVVDRPDSLKVFESLQSFI